MMFPGTLVKLNMKLYLARAMWSRPRDLSGEQNRVVGMFNAGDIGLVVSSHQCRHTKFNYVMIMTSVGELGWTMDIDLWDIDEHFAGVRVTP